MAVITAPVSNPALIINAANTNDNSVSLDGLFPDGFEYARVYLYGISAPIQFNTLDVIGASSPSFTTTDNGIILSVKKGNLLHIKGLAGSETFKLSLLPDKRFQGLGAD